MRDNAQPKQMHNPNPIMVRNFTPEYHIVVLHSKPDKPILNPIPVFHSAKLTTFITWNAFNVVFDIADCNLADDDFLPPQNTHRMNEYYDYEEGANEEGLNITTPYSPLRFKSLPLDLPSGKTVNSGNSTLATMYIPQYQLTFVTVSKCDVIGILTISYHFAQCRRFSRTLQKPNNGTIRQ